MVMRPGIRPRVWPVIMMVVMVVVVIGDRIPDEPCGGSAGHSHSRIHRLHRAAGRIIGGHAIHTAKCESADGRPMEKSNSGLHAWNNATEAGLFKFFGGIFAASAATATAGLRAWPGHTQQKHRQGECHDQYSGDALPVHAQNPMSLPAWNTSRDETYAKPHMKANCPAAHFHDPASRATTAEVGRHCSAYM